MPTTSHAPDTWWSETLDALKSDLDSLVEDFIERLLAVGSGYARVAQDDIRTTARETLTLLIAELRGERVSDELASLPQRLGVRRARQGIDRDRLLEAVRLDYRVLWAGLMRIVDPSDSVLLVAHAEVVLSTVEEYINKVQVAFLNEREALVRDTRATETRALAKLLAADDPTLVADEIAADLDVDAHATFEAILIPDAAASTARRRITEVQQSRHRFLIWDFDDGVLFVRPVQDRPGPHPLAGIHGVIISEIPGLAAVADAARLAHRLAPHAPPGRLSEEQDLWAPVAAAALAPLLPAVSPRAVDGLEQVSPAERSRLIDTFLAYCDSGSIKHTAEAGFVHRNTVVNRLRAFHTLTGINPTVPKEAARAMIALAGTS